MTIELLFICDRKGDNMIHRSYRLIDSTKAMDLYRVFVHNNRSQSRISNINQVGEFFFIHYRITAGYTLVASTTKNCNVIYILEILKKTKELLVRMIDFNNFGEERNHYLMILALFEELMDYGYAQTMDAASLETLLCVKGFTNIPKSQMVQHAVTAHLTGRTVWRRENIKYAHPKVIVSVLETLSASFNNVSESPLNITGSIKVNAELSGMPKVAFNFPKTDFTDIYSTSSNDPKSPNWSYQNLNISFDKCVCSGEYEKTGRITFVPPDEVFELAKYRLTSKRAQPFHCNVVYTRQSEFSGNIDLHVTAELTNYLRRPLKILVQIPEETVKTTFTMSRGKISNKTGGGVVVWKLKKVNGKDNFQLGIQLKYDHARTVKEVKTVSFEFELPYLQSGIRAGNMLIHEPQYPNIDRDCEKLVSYFTKSLKYEYRYEI